MLGEWVDFHYDVDGKTYDLALQGGDAINLRELLAGLKVFAAKDADLFMAEVKSVEFSDTSLVAVAHVGESITAGELRERYGLQAQYSAEVTDEQIAAMDAKRFEPGDWALLSLRPFSSDEKLTVTMNNGDVLTVRVTDAQITTLFLSASGKLYEVTVTYDQAAGIPEGSSLRVTEFAEDTAEYEYARNAVLADKKARGEGVDLSSFGLAALDISILDPSGTEIEPQAPVQVDIRIKGLPGVEDLSEVANTLAIQHHVEVGDGVVVETVYDGSAEASFRLETDAAVAAEGTAVDPSSVSEDDFAAPPVEKVDDVNVEFEAEAFSTFTISWNNAYGNGTKIHYVDESGRDLNVANAAFPTTIGANSTSPAYLIYDIDGYEYSYTYLKRGNNEIRIYPYIDKDAYGWGYYALNGGSYYFPQNQDAYVVYKKKNDIPQGGTPTVKQSGSTEPPVSPRINKESTPNGDDTNTLALSLISDTAELEVEKLADVIVVFDVSGSMSTKDMGNSTSRLQAAQKAVKDLADELAKKKNSDGEPLVRMSLIKFSTKGSSVIGLTELTDDGLSSFKRKVNGLEADGGTNWDHALQLANEENDLDSGRATFVIFVTDGDPTFRNTRMDLTDQELQDETYNYYYLTNNVYGPGSDDYDNRCYDAAVQQGEAIVAAGKNIYTIGISNDVKKVDSFNSDIGGNGAYLAADSGALQQAFADIEASISGAAGWGNIKMTDGITSLTNTVQKTGLTNVGGDFTYWIAPAPENWKSMTEAEKNAYKPAADDFIEWDPASAGAALAQYNSQTGAVEWSMGSTFMPEAGVTYQVRFKVWPSQEAYDYIAKLNNGTVKYDELPAGIKAQIIKNGNTYTLKTNESDAKTTYQAATKTGNTVTVSGDTKTLMFPPVEDLGLSVDKMTVTKEWQNSLDPDSRWKSPVTLLLTDGSGTPYKSIDLNEDNNYTAQDNFISCGLAKIENNELVIYEKGHDFKLAEPEEYAYYWDLDSQVYRPMIINAKLTMLEKADAPSGMGNKTYYTDQEATYYKIDGGTYKAVSTGDAAAKITATNVRRSNLNLTKKVVDENGDPVISSDAFGFTVTINDTQDDDVWFSVQTDANDVSTIVKDLSTNATAEIKNGKKTGYYHASSGSQITVSIEPGWNLRFTNLPNGTTYTITEDSKENYSFVSAEIDNGGTFSEVEGTTTGNGTINKSDTQYTVTYTNLAKTQQVYIQKTDQEGTTPLPGATFALYTKSGYEADPKAATKTGLTSGADGKIDLGKLACGTYYLVETSAPEGYIKLADPVTILVESNGVTYNQSDQSQSSSGEGATFDKATKTYTLRVTNNAGAELPAAGGPGTWGFTVLGSVLILGAGALLWSRRKLA